MVFPITIKIEPADDSDDCIFVPQDKKITDNSDDLDSDGNDVPIHKRLRFISLSSMSSSSSDEDEDVLVKFHASCDDEHRTDLQCYQEKCLKTFKMLSISVKEDEVKPIGYVKHIVNTQVVVQSYPGLCPIDLDCVLFLDQGKTALGKIDELFGKVDEPCYIVRFNKIEEIKEKNIEQKMVVFYAPNSRHTKFINVADLKSHKGSDASWLADREPPESALDYSDDEEEKKAKRRHEQERMRNQEPKYSFWQDY